MNSYKGYSLFKDVDDVALRTWNRCTVMLNMNVDQGEDFVRGYVGSLSDVERMQVMTMYQYIAIKGTEVVRLEINQGKHAVEDNKVVH